MQRIPQFFVVYVILLIGYLTACNNNTQEVTLRKVKASSSKSHVKSKKQKVLVSTDNMLETSNYEGISGNIPRLKAMLSGEFTAYNTDSDPEQKTYSPWLVNEGQDSVILCTFPVGEPSRHGHWLYMSQYLTSLPDEPIHAYFVHLEEINRDSIIAIYYSVPDDFAHSRQDMLAAPKELFRAFDFEALTPVQSGEKVWYERRSLLEYYGHSHWIKIKEPLRTDLKGGFNRNFYIVTPDKYHSYKKYYNKSKKFVTQEPTYHLNRNQILARMYRGQ